MPINHLPIRAQPIRAQPMARRFREWALTDGPGLAILGIGIILRGISYLPIIMGNDARASHPAEGVLTMDQWAVIWIAIGTLCMVATVWDRAAPAALGAGVGLNILWGASFIADGVIDQSPRGWLPAVGYVSTALLILWAVWRGSRDDIPQEEVARELRK